MAKFQLTPSPQFNKRRSKKAAFVLRESDAQRSLFSWASWARSKYPDLDLMCAIPNGFPLHGEQRFAVVNYMKAQGLKPGVPDVGLFSPRRSPEGGYYGGLWLEMKVPGGKLSPFQEIWINNLRRAGYYVCVCDSLEQAIAELEMYCQLPSTQP